MSIIVKILPEKPYTILWVQGNHENYDMIGEYPLEEWHGGKARHIIRDKVILLERGQAFEIDGKTFSPSEGHLPMTFREEFWIVRRWISQNRSAGQTGIIFPTGYLQESWWPQELPTEGELQEGLRNLERYHYEVDYVITHCCASTLQDRINAGTGRSCAPDLLTDYLETLEQKLHYRHWYFGHYHWDCQPDDKHTLVYYAILPLEQKESVNAVPVPGQTEGETNHGKR